MHASNFPTTVLNIVTGEGSVKALVCTIHSIYTPYIRPPTSYVIIFMYTTCAMHANTFIYPLIHSLFDSNSYILLNGIVFCR